MPEKNINNMPEKAIGCENETNPCQSCTGEDNRKSDMTDSGEASHLYFSSPCLLPEMENDGSFRKWYSDYK